MRAEEIEKLPVIIDMMLGESVIVDTKEKLHEKLTKVCNLAIKALDQEPKKGYISIDDVMSVFDDFMCGEVDENGMETFLEMLKDKVESEG